MSDPAYQLKVRKALDELHEGTGRADGPTDSDRCVFPNRSHELNRDSEHAAAEGDERALEEGERDARANPRRPCRTQGSTNRSIWKLTMTALIDFLRPDYPQLSRDKTGVRRVYAFRGLTAAIVPILPKIGATWLDFYPVADVRHNPIGTSDWSDAIVETYQIDAEATTEKTDDQYPNFEIDQVQIEAAAPASWISSTASPRPTGRR